MKEEKEWRDLREKDADAKMSKEDRHQKKKKAMTWTIKK